MKRSTQDDWFDVILNADTELFLDPFLVFKEQSPRWRDAHDKLIGHFDRVFRLIADGNRNPASLQYRKALDLLIFPEPRELCLGYTAHGTAGAGSGRGYARLIAEAIVEAISRGLQSPRHFEELGVLQNGIGADRISDITCTVLKEDLIRYTQDVCNRHGIPLAEQSLYAAAFDQQRERWEVRTVEVPTNPSTGGPLLFVPRRFVRDLPTLNDRDWWDYYENEQLRTDLNYEIMRNVDKATIIQKARENPELVRQWTQSREDDPPKPYDFNGDPAGVWQWDAATSKFAAAHPVELSPPQSEEQFLEVIERVLEQFRLFVEDQGGWELLWEGRGRKDKPERASQLLFRGIAQSYCIANNISLDPEVNLGRGPVDFKFSNGYALRAHLEVKKLHNGKFWNGLESQLPAYMRSDQVRNGWFLAIQYREGKPAERRIRELPHRVQALAQAKSLRLGWALVDARPRESASRL